MDLLRLAKRSGMGGMDLLRLAKRISMAGMDLLRLAKRSMDHDNLLRLSKKDQASVCFVWPKGVRWPAWIYFVWPRGAWIMTTCLDCLRKIRHHGERMITSF